MCISDYIQAAFFYLGRFLKKVADDHCSSITKGSIYHIKHVHTTFYNGSGQTWNCFMEVSFMFDICSYYVFTLYSTILAMHTWIQTFTFSPVCHFQFVLQLAVDGIKRALVDVRFTCGVTQRVDHRRASRLTTADWALVWIILAYLPLLAFKMSVCTCLFCVGYKLHSDTKNEINFMCRSSQHSKTWT